MENDKADAILFILGVLALVVVAGYMVAAVLLIVLGLLRSFA